jgi:hypothetical protein
VESLCLVLWVEMVGETSSQSTQPEGNKGGTMIPAYPKIYALGHPALANLLEGPVVVQEKVDGSQFSFGLLDGVLACRSRGREIFLEAPDSMFKAGVDYVKTIQDQLVPGWIYRCEYLRVPNHNTLAYTRIPTHHLVLFDILIGLETYATRANLAFEAEKLGIDAVPYVYQGEIDLEKFQGFMARESYLGGQTVEGVVIKNYERFCQKTGHVLIGKYVSEEFKEVHNASWKERHPGKKDIMAVLIGKYKTVARWEKAVYRLRDQGTLCHEPRDIGSIIKEVWPDIVAECEQEIKDDLWKFFSKDIQRGCTAGLPEWYKQRLMHQQFEGKKLTRECEHDWEAVYGGATLCKKCFVANDDPTYGDAS